MKVSGAVAIVTGGASGIGKAICQKLLENGAKVCIADIQQVAGTNAAAEFAARFPSNHVLFVHCDVTNRESFAAAFQKAEAALGRVNILCNNAGSIFEHQWEKTIQLNLVGMMYGMEIAIERMGRQNGGQGGVVINTASVGGCYPFPNLPAYCATKAAVCMYTKCMAARQLKQQGVRISAVCPTVVETPLLEISIRNAVISEERMRAETERTSKLKPREVADAVHHLISDDTKNGTLLQVFPSLWNEFSYPKLPVARL